MGGLIQDLDQNLNWGFPELNLQGRGQYVNKPFRKFLNPIFDLRGNERILDVGCGVGTLSKLIAPFLKLDGEIIGIDLDPKLIEYGNQHWGRRASIRLEVGNANQIAYPNNYFDVVAAMGLLEGISDSEQVLSEMLRVCKRPGKLIIIHIDVLNHTVSPREKNFERFFRALLQGQLLMGMDIDMARFLAACKTKKLPLETFTFLLEYSIEITDTFITLSEQGMQEFYKTEGLLQQNVDFHYQFIKWMGWSEKKLRKIFDPNYTIKAYINNLRANLGKKYSRSTPLKIYRIYISD